MTGERESLRLVTSEAELREGMLLKVQPCGCNGTHYVLVLRLNGVGPCPCGEDSLRVVLDQYPHADLRTPSSCMRPAIRKGILYRVEWPRDDEAEQQKHERLDRELAADLAKQRPRQPAKERAR